jgi:lysophospholipase L1-like esterase
LFIVSRAVPGLFASAVALVLVLLVGEIVPRLIALPQAIYARDTANPGLYQLDDLAGYVMVARYGGRLHSADFDQTFMTNDRGLRGANPDNKAPGEFRIVVLGDSFVMGAEVPPEQAFTDRLAALLHQRGYTYVTVVGVGVRGWGTYNEAGFLQENIDWLQPDLVVLSLYVGNIGENVLATAAGYQLRGGNIAYGPPAEALEGDSVTWFTHNFSVRAAEYAQPTFQDPGWNPCDGFPVPRGNTAVSTGGVSAIANGGSSYVLESAIDAARTWLHTNSLLYRGASDGWFRIRFGYNRPEPLMLDNWLVYTLRNGPRLYWYDLAVPLTVHYVDRARAVAARVGAATVTAIVPRDAQVDVVKLQAQLAQYQLSQDEIDLEKPQRDLTSSIQRLGMPVLDLAPVFRARADLAQLFFPHDIHFTARGHEVAAENLADWLEGLGQLPSH